MLIFNYKLLLLLVFNHSFIFSSIKSSRNSGLLDIKDQLNSDTENKDVHITSKSINSNFFNLGMGNWSAIGAIVSIILVFMLIGFIFYYKRRRIVSEN